MKRPSASDFERHRREMGWRSHLSSSEKRELRALLTTHAKSDLTADWVEELESFNFRYQYLLWLETLRPSNKENRRVLQQMLANVVQLGHALYDPHLPLSHVIFNLWHESMYRSPGSDVAPLVNFRIISSGPTLNSPTHHRIERGLLELQEALIRSIEALERKKRGGAPRDETQRSLIFNVALFLLGLGIEPKASENSVWARVVHCLMALREADMPDGEALKPKLVQVLRDLRQLPGWAPRARRVRASATGKKT